MAIVDLKVAERHAIALLNLTDEQQRHVQELRDLFRRSRHSKERAEIRDALLDIMHPEGIAEPGDLASSVSDGAHRRVSAYHQSVGNEVRRRRKAQGLTQSQLAAKAGLRKATFRGWSAAGMCQHILRSKGWRKHWVHGPKR